MKVYEDFKVYGPYKRKDGRQHVCLVKYENGKQIRKTVSYPKYLVELNLNRYLTDNETVDHDDRNFENNEISNLVIRDRSNHCSLDAKRLKDSEFSCEYCGIEFVIEGSKLNTCKHNRNKGKRGPFCSRTCAGKASQNIENFQIKKVDKKYYYLNK